MREQNICHCCCGHPLARRLLLTSRLDFEMSFFAPDGTAIIVGSVHCDPISSVSWSWMESSGTIPLISLMDAGAVSFST
jgi:hypothetical protein